MIITEDFIVTANSPQELGMQLIDAGILELREAGAFPPEGAVFSYIGENSNGAHAFVSITAESAAIDVIKAKILALINVPGAPLRMRAGGILPQVTQLYRVFAIRAALEKLNMLASAKAAITALVQAAGGDKEISTWFDYIHAISGQEPRWLALVQQAGWTQQQVDGLFALAGQIQGSYN